jgi:MFS family permease
MKRYHYVVIGAGAGGLVVAVGLAKAGRRVLLIEKGELGGDCTNVGCIPSKALIAAAEVAHMARTAHKLGLKEQTHHISSVEAGTGTSLMYLGMLFGSPLIGLWSDMLGYRRPLMIAGSLVAALASGVLIFFKGLPMLVVFALLTLLGFAVGAQFLGFSVIIELNSPKTKGSALAFNNFVTTLGAVIMQPGVGLLLDISRNLAGRSTYSPGDYQLALSTLPISALIAAALAWRMRETHGRDTSGHLHPFEPHCD